MNLLCNVFLRALSGDSLHWLLTLESVGDRGR